MNSRWGIAVLVAALSVLGACRGGGDDGNKVSTQSTGKTTSTFALGFDETTTTAETDAAGSSATTVKKSAPGAATAGTATTVKPGATATTGRSAADPSAPATAPKDPNAIPAPAQTGTYRYAQSGTMPDGNPAPPSGTLVVSGGSTQIFKRAFSSNQSVTLTYQFRSNGPYVTAATIVANGVTINCNFANGVPLPPWPPSGSFSGSATCSNGLRATLSGSVGGRSMKGGHDVVRINSVLKITGNGVNVDVTDVEDWAVNLRVPTYSQQTFSGTTPFGPINGQITSNLTGTP